MAALGRSINRDARSNGKKRDIEMVVGVVALGTR